MDITAALTPAEVATLSDPERACGAAKRQLEIAVRSNEAASSFEESLRLKNTLDAFEEKGV